MVRDMKKGSVIVDVAIDSGRMRRDGSRDNALNPLYEVDGVIHYCVANMRRSAAHIDDRADECHPRRRRSQISDSRKRLRSGSCRSVNVYKGAITYKAVAEAQSRSYTPLAH